MIIFGGLYGQTKQAVQIALMNCASLLHIFSTGFDFTSSAIIGHDLGNGNLKSAVE